MYTNAIRTSLLAACLLASITTTPLAQSALPPDEGMIGMIPGTTMSRDEFRARANAQLTTVALNAEAFRMVYGQYPGSFNELYNSPAWNLAPVNMFSGEPVNAVYFDAMPTDLIPNQEAGLPAGLNLLPPLPPVQQGSDGDGAEDNGGAAGAGSPGIPVGGGIASGSFLSVDPAKVVNITFGDIFYRAFEDTLQMLVYAPDGTFHEYYSSSPNLYWHKHMSAVTSGSYWPDDGYSGQVMYFTETLLPRLYNHVMFMADLEVLPGSALHLYGVDARLQMAEELGITILNPFSKRPIRLVGSYELGNFVEPNPAAPVPIFFCFNGRRILSLKQVFEAQLEEARSGKRGKATRNPRRPSMGGSR